MKELIVNTLKKLCDLLKKGITQIIFAFIWVMLFGYLSENSLDNGDSNMYFNIAMIGVGFLIIFVFVIIKRGCQWTYKCDSKNKLK